MANVRAGKERGWGVDDAVGDGFMAMLTFGITVERSVKPSSPVNGTEDIQIKWKFDARLWIAAILIGLGELGLEYGVRKVLHEHQQTTMATNVAIDTTMVIKARRSPKLDRS